MMPELMLPKSMHDSAVEAARLFGRQDAEREALKLIALLVEAAGGAITLTDRAIIGDGPDLFLFDDPLTYTRTYRTKRR